MNRNWKTFWYDEINFPSYYPLFLRPFLTVCLMNKNNKTMSNTFSKSRLSPRVKVKRRRPGGVFWLCGRGNHADVLQRFPDNYSMCRINSHFSKPKVQCGYMYKNTEKWNIKKYICKCVTSIKDERKDQLVPWDNFYETTPISLPVITPTNFLQLAIMCKFFLHCEILCLKQGQKH